MHRTEGENNASNLFTDGPPGTTVEEDWLNAVQEEICYVIEQSGITLKTAATETRTQLLAALMSGLTALTQIKFTPLTAAPATLSAGLVVMADRVTWDPLGIGAGGAYLTMYLGGVSGWGAITGQLD